MVDLYRSGRELEPKEIYEWLKELRTGAYAPSSGFLVSAVVKTMVNDVPYYFAGVNVENIVDRFTMHAEDSAVAAMATALGKNATIADVYVLGAHKSTGPDDAAAHEHTTPCGKCRQHMNDFMPKSSWFHTFAYADGTMVTYSPNSLLGHDFGLQSIDPGLNAARAAAQTATTGGVQDVMRKMVREIGPTNRMSYDDIQQWLSELESVDFLKGDAESMVIRLTNGMYVAGAQVKDAAYCGNSAAHSATSIARSLLGEAFGDSVKIAEAWVKTPRRNGVDFPGNVKPPRPTADTIGVLAEFASHPSITVNCSGMGKTNNRYYLSDLGATPTFADPSGNSALVRSI